METSVKIFRNLTSVYPLMAVNDISRRILCNEEIRSSLIFKKFFKYYSPLLSLGKFTRDQSKIVKKDGTIIKKKTPPKVQINLIRDSDIVVLTMEAAENIAKANDLNLVKVKGKSVRETYKLVSDTELADDLMVKSSEKSKSKKYFLNAGIDDNDLQRKLKSMIEYLQKNYVVNCVIKNQGNENRIPGMVEKIKAELKREEIDFSATTSKSSNNIMSIILKKKPSQDSSQGS